MSKIMVTRSSMTLFEEYCEEIRDLWDSHWLTNMGSKRKQYQGEMEEYLNAEHVTLFTNGHMALENAIAALNISKGGEVLPLRLPLHPQYMLLFEMDCPPVFCDIKEDNFTIDVQKIEKLIF